MARFSMPRNQTGDKPGAVLNIADQILEVFPDGAPVTQVMLGKVKCPMKLLFKADFPFGLEKIGDLIPGHFLGVRSHADEEPVGALIRFVFALGDIDDGNIFKKIDCYRNRRLAVVCDILNLGTSPVIGRNTGDGSFVGDADKNSSAGGIGKGSNLSGKLDTYPLFEFDEIAFAFLNNIVKFLVCHAWFCSPPSALCSQPIHYPLFMIMPYLVSRLSTLHE